MQNVVDGLDEILDAVVVLEHREWFREEFVYSGQFSCQSAPLRGVGAHIKRKLLPRVVRSSAPHVRHFHLDLFDVYDGLVEFWVRGRAEDESSVALSERRSYGTVWCLVGVDAVSGVGMMCVDEAQEVKVCVNARIGSG